VHRAYKAHPRRASEAHAAEVLLQRLQRRWSRGDEVEEGLAVVFTMPATAVQNREPERLPCPYTGAVVKVRRRSSAGVVRYRLERRSS
jgi:hypothetical protein